MADNNFPLEKILNVSATEYCASVGKELKDYELRGVHLESGKSDFFTKIFAEIVPRGAEVVVNYAMSVSTSQSLFRGYTSFQGTGTALIPKRE